MLIRFLALLWLALFVGCSAPETGTYAAPPRSDAQLREELAAACRSRRAEQGPVLVEFSAPWCSDCQRLHEMKQQPALAKELEAWPNVTINVGMFDLHRDLLDHFGIQKIAHWSIFRPSDCSEPIERWPRVIARTLEPSSGAERDTSPAELANWLRGYRSS